jgi:hypothetical protein
MPNDATTIQSVTNTSINHCVLSMAVLERINKKNGAGVIGNIQK